MNLQIVQDQPTDWEYHTTDGRHDVAVQRIFEDKEWFYLWAKSTEGPLWHIISDSVIDSLDEATKQADVTLFNLPDFFEDLLLAPAGFVPYNRKLGYVKATFDIITYQDFNKHPNNPQRIIDYCYPNAGNFSQLDSGSNRRIPERDVRFIKCSDKSYAVDICLCPVHRKFDDYEKSQQPKEVPPHGSNVRTMPLRG